MLHFRKFHPICKFLFLMSFSAVFFVNQATQIAYILLAFLFLLLSARFNPLKSKTLWICIIALLFLSFITHRGPLDVSFLLKAFILIAKWGVVLMTGYIYAEWMTPTELIYIIRKGLRSKKAELPVIVGIKTLPHAIETSSRIKLAQTARGLILKRWDFRRWGIFISTFISAFLAYFFQFLFDLYMILSIRLGNRPKGTIFRSYSFGWFEAAILLYVVTLPAVLYFI